MPNVFENNTQIPASRVALVERDYPSRPWYRWFFNIYTAIESSRRYGLFYDTATHSAGAINTAYALTYNGAYVGTNGANLASGILVVGSRLVVNIAANFTFQYSIRFVNTLVGVKNISLWPRINGVNVANSARQFTLTGALNEATVIDWGFVLNLAAGDYVELMWSTDNTNVQIAAAAASAPVPAIPSVVLTVTSSVGV